MAEDKKDDKHEEGGGWENATVIPVKYITPILIALIAIGTFGKMIAPNFTASLGPMIVDPFASVLWAYGAIMFIATMLGDKKSPTQILASITPMIVLAIVIPIIFGSGSEYVIGPILFIILAPIAGTLLRKKAGFEDDEKHEYESDEKKAKEAALELKKPLIAAKSAAENERKELGQEHGRVMHLLKRTHKFGHELLKKSEKDLKKERQIFADEAQDLEKEIEASDHEIYQIREPHGDTVKGKELQKLLDALDEIKSQLSIVANSLGA